MNWNKLFLTTPVSEIPKIINNNFEHVNQYMNVFYDNSVGVIVVPLQTTGDVTASKGEFVTAVVDNLIVRKQYTNLLENYNTADYSYYTTLIEPPYGIRDACTGAGHWPYEDDTWNYVDVERPYYKITNEKPVFFQNNSISQVVGVILDPSLYSGDDFQIIMDPCEGTSFVIDASNTDDYVEFICTDFDASWGPTWTKYK